MSNPYAPPSTQEEHPGTPSNNDTILRRIGAIALLCNVVRILWHTFTSPTDGAVTIFSLIGSLVFMGSLIYGFMRGGKGFHLAIALLFELSIASHVFVLWYTQPQTEPGQVNPWLSLALQLAPATIVSICATALYLRARRGVTPAV